jgi:hypothetical protein
MTSIPTRTVAVAALLAAVSTFAAAGEKHDVEIGVGLAGATLVKVYDDSVLTFTVPQLGSAYASLFVTPHVVFEPQLSLLITHVDGETDDHVSLGAQLAYLFRGKDTGSTYVFGRGVFADGKDTDSATSVGGGIGQRIRLGERAALRLEAHYDHLLETNTHTGANMFSVQLSVGVLP